MTSTIKTTEVTDAVSINIENYNQLLITISMGDYWNSTDNTHINIQNALLNDQNIWFYNNEVGVGGAGSNNGRMAYAIALVNCNPNEINTLKIITKSVGNNFSITKKYAIYGIE